MSSGHFTIFYAMTPKSSLHPLQHVGKSIPSRQSWITAEVVSLEYVTNLAIICISKIKHNPNELHLNHHS